MGTPSLPDGPQPEPMSRDEVDRTLTALRAAYDRIAAAMYTVDSHSGLAYLRGSGLSGTTRSVAEHVTQLIALLWARFAALRTPLEDAESIREARSRPGERELVAMTRLLRTKAVGLGDDGFPVDSLAVARRMTLSELATSLENDVHGLAEVLGDVDDAVARVAARLARLTDALGEVRSQAEALGADAGRRIDLTKLSATLDEARVRALADPIELARGGAGAAAAEDLLRDLAADVDAARHRLAEPLRVRQTHPKQLAGLRTRVAEVAEAEEHAAQSLRVVDQKIAEAHLPGPPQTAAGLADRLSHLDQLVQDEQWSRLADEIAAISHAATESIRYAHRLRTAADGLMDRREELRGRLRGYQAKAARVGFAEQAELTAAHHVAQDILYTSPCDLPAATRAVFRYQQLLADLEKENHR